MAIYAKVSGVIQKASKVHFCLSGVWAVAERLWAYASGGWQSAWENEIRYINTADRTTANIYQLMGSPTEVGNYVFENRATISAGVGTYALRTGSFPSGSTLLIVNKGYIRGKGGNGGAYNTAGEPGGAALYVDFACTLDNGVGYIFSGGGGGGGAQQYNGGGYYNRAAGGGGAGSTPGLAGGGSLTSVSASGATDPGPGGLDTGGVGGYRRIYNSNALYTNSYGGAGGSPGNPGVAGRWEKGPSVSVTSIAYVGGAAGAAISRNGLTVTIVAGNDADRFKGGIV